MPKLVNLPSVKGMLTLTQNDIATDGGWDDGDADGIKRGKTGQRSRSVCPS